MRVLLFADDASLAESFSRAGMRVTRVPLGTVADPGATAALAAGLRAAEEALAGDPPDAVLIGGDGDEALAVALTAVKLEVPTLWLRPADVSGDALVGRVADMCLDATAGAEALSTAVRELAAPTISAR